VLVGIGLALIVSLAKSAVRPVANVVTGGAAAPALSTAEDGASVVLVVLAFVAPVLVLIALAFLLWLFVALIRSIRKKRRAKAAAQASQLA
jgi:large-conductance mechanosensitive channel